MWGELAPPTAPQERLCHGRPPDEIQAGGMGTGRVGCSRWMTLSA
jgi:hypothetical protein